MQNAIPETGNKVLKPEVLEFINKPLHRLELAKIQGITEAAVIKQISRNSTVLTEYAPLEYIRKVYGCIEAGELLEPQKQSVTN